MAETSVKEHQPIRVISESCFVSCWSAVHRVRRIASSRFWSITGEDWSQAISCARANFTRLPCVFTSRRRRMVCLCASRHIGREVKSIGARQDDKKVSSTRFECGSIAFSLIAVRSPITVHRSAVCSVKETGCCWMFVQPVNQPVSALCRRLRAEAIHSQESADHSV
jgi:hypothetical protein